MDTASRKPPAIEGSRLVGAAIENVGISPNEVDSNLEPANIVDGLFAISRSIRHLARMYEAGLILRYGGPDVESARGYQDKRDR